MTVGRGMEDAFFASWQREPRRVAVRGDAVPTDCWLPGSEPESYVLCPLTSTANGLMCTGTDTSSSRRRSIAGNRGETKRLIRSPKQLWKVIAGRFHGHGSKPNTPYAGSRTSAKARSPSRTSARVGRVNLIFDSTELDFFCNRGLRCAFLDRLIGNRRFDFALNSTTSFRVAMLIELIRSGFSAKAPAVVPPPVRRRGAVWRLPASGSNGSEQSERTV